MSQICFTHFDDQGNAIMVDVSEKPETARLAIAQGRIRVNRQVMDAIRENAVEKGDVLGVARIAGIMGAKKNAELIPMCHPLLITKCAIDFCLDFQSNEIQPTCTVKINGKTGVEMEALTGVSIALLTIYDMCKAIDKGMEITGIVLREKSGVKAAIIETIGCNESEGEE